MRENLSLKKYSNVIAYENAQLKETLRRQKGYWADTAPPRAPAPAATTHPPQVLPAGKERFQRAIFVPKIAHLNQAGRQAGRQAGSRAVLR